MTARGILAESSSTIDASTGVGQPGWRLTHVAFKMRWLACLGRERPVP